MAQFPFIGAAYKARAAVFNAEQCINLYPEIGNPTAKNVMCLLGTPGKRLWVNLPGGAVRGLFRFSAFKSIAVSGPNVYVVTSAGVATLIGAITGGDTPVSMAANGSVVMLGAGTTGYSVDPVAGTVTQIVDPDFQGADSIGFIDGYFIFNKPGTGQFQITDLYSTDVDPLDFATAEGSPDLLLSLLVDHREVWLFGETSTEVWWNSGNPDFPFERINGAFIEQGTAAKYSPAKMDNSVYWLAFNEEGAGQVMRAAGYQPERVSDHGVEYAIGQMSRIDDAIGYTYQQEGHHFYVLTFPTAQQTWVLDSATGMWHQRAYRNTVTNAAERDRAMCQMNFAGKVLVGDHTNGNVYQLDLDYFTDNGDPIVRTRTSPYLSDMNYRFQAFDWLQVDMLMGVGLSVRGPGGDGEASVTLGWSTDPSMTEGPSRVYGPESGVSGEFVAQEFSWTEGYVPAEPGYDPQVILQWSDDGGQTWSNEHMVSAGKIGERRRRARWRRLGRSRARVFRVRIVEPVRVALVGASVGVRVARA